MNTQSNAMPESPSGARAVTAVEISAVHRMYWLVRRELWENRSIYIAPLAVAPVALFGSLIEVLTLPHRMGGALSTLDPMHQQELIEQPYTLAALLIMFTTVVVGVFYCIDALQSERRDRSILFWKSLPVSDLETVLSKASIPFLVLPLVTFAVTLGTQWIMLLMGSAVLAARGASPAILWTHISLVQIWAMMLYHLLAVHSLWWAPYWGWLLLVSAWARRAALLWATLPLLAIGILEKIAFNTSHFAALLGYRFMGSPGGEASSGHDMTMAALTPSPGHFLASPSLWIGLAFAALCLAAAVRLRRYREPI